LLWQQVFIVSFDPYQHTTPAGVQRRVMHTECIHIWGDAGTITCNGYLYIMCLQHIIEVLTREGHVFNEVSVFTDGCGPQYKCRQACYGLTEIATQFGAVVDHTWAPTATFKGLHDAAGGYAKRFMRYLELSEQLGCRASCARDVKSALSTHMPQPRPPDPNTCALQQLSRRRHFLVVERAHATETDYNRTDVIVIDNGHENWDCTPVTGIRSSYNVRAYPASDAAVDGQRVVDMRNHPCACDNCVRRVSPCLLTGSTGSWKKMKMRLKRGKVRAKPTFVDDDSADEEEDDEEAGDGDNVEDNEEDEDGGSEEDEEDEEAAEWEVQDEQDEDEEAMRAVNISKQNEEDFVVAMA
jgi:hypothetical protein